jgi:AcrR family transcriptional regulator
LQLLNGVHHLNGMHMGVAERRARETKQLKRQILDAARELFVRDGYDTVSMRKIADKIEYAPGTIYHYFQNKDEILDCLCEETFLKLHHEKLGKTQARPGKSLASLKEGMETYIRFGLSHPEDYIVTFILRAAPFEGSKVGETRKAKAGQLCFNEMRNAVRRCIEEGKIKGDLEETSQALWAGIHGVTALLITQPGFPFVKRDRLIKRTIEILLRGVSADSASER